MIAEISQEFASGVSTGAIAMLAGILFLLFLSATEPRQGVRGRTSPGGPIIPPQGGSGTVNTPNTETPHATE